MATAKRVGRPAKPKAQQKTFHLRVRFTEAHGREIEAAAGRVGLSLSAWVTERLLKAARQENAKQQQ